MQNSLGVRSRSTPESEAIDKAASIRMRRVLTEAFAEFDFENELPQVSQCVERWRIAKEETAKEEAAVEERLGREKAAKKEAAAKEITEEETIEREKTEEEMDEEELYYGSERYKYSGILFHDAKRLEQQQKQEEEHKEEQQQQQEKENKENAAVGGAHGCPDSHKDYSAGGWYGYPSSEKDAPAKEVYDGCPSSKKDYSAEGWYGFPSSEKGASEGGAYDCGRGQSKGDDGGRLSVKEYQERKCSAAVTAAVEAWKEKRLDAAKAAMLRGQPFAKCSWKETIRQHNETRQLQVAEWNGALSQPQASSPATLVVSLSQRPRLHGLIRRGNARRAIGAEQMKRIARMYKENG